MFEKKLKHKIEEVKKSIVAIGVKYHDRVNILGSGFHVGDGKILSVAHVYNQIPEKDKEGFSVLAMTKIDDGLEHYSWFPLKLIKKIDQDDVALYEISNPERTLLGKLELGDSDEVAIGDDAYFIGFPYAAQLMNDGFGVTLIVNKGMISNIKLDGIDPKHKRNFIVVDAISNPGNSGCPLIDMETNKVIGIMAIAFRTKSRTNPDLDIREPMHIGGAKPINLVKDLMK